MLGQAAGSVAGVSPFEKRDEKRVHHQLNQVIDGERQCSDRIVPEEAFPKIDAIGQRFCEPEKTRAVPVPLSSRKSRLIPKFQPNRIACSRVETSAMRRTISVLP